VNDEELRRWLAQRLRLPEIPDLLWNHLVEEEYVREARQLPAEGREQLVRIAKQRLELARALAGRRTPPGRAVSTEMGPVLSTYEVARPAAVGALVAAQAAATPRVRDFRWEILGGRDLSPEEARRLVASPAAQALVPGTFARHGIPLVGHEARVVGVRHSDPGASRWSREVTVAVEWEGGSCEETRPWSGSGPRPYLALAAFDERWREERVPVFRGSLLDEVRELAGWLAREHGWLEPQATWFVLTGSVVPRLPLRVAINGRAGYGHTSCRVTLDVEPWVSADTVLRAYRDVQRRVLPGDNRPVGERSLALARFVAEQERDGERRTWRVLRTRWNEAHPDQPYEEDRRFRRDVVRANQILLFPPYRLPLEDDDQGDMT